MLSLFSISHPFLASVPANVFFLFVIVFAYVSRVIVIISPPIRGSNGYPFIKEPAQKKKKKKPLPSLKGEEGGLNRQREGRRARPFFFSSLVRAHTECLQKRLTPAPSRPGIGQGNWLVGRGRAGQAMVPL